AHMLYCMLGEPWGIAGLSLSLGGLNLYATDLLVLLLAAAWLLGGLRAGRLPARPRDPIVIAMTLYLLYGLFSLARSWPLHGRAALPDFRMQFLYALLFPLCLWAFARPETRRVLLGSVIGAAALISLLGFANAIAGRPVGMTTSSLTYRYLSGLQALAAFFGLSLIAGYVWSRARPAWSLLLGALCLAAVLLAQARSVWLGGALALLVALGGATAATRRRLLRHLPLVGAVGLIALAAVFALNLGLTEDLATRAASLAEVSTDLTTIWRLYVWGEAWNDLRASPLLGLGLGREFAYFDAFEGAWRTDRQLHNSHLELAYYTGWIGALLLVAFQLLVLLRTLRAARRAGGTPGEGRLLALAACQVCLAGVSFTNVISASLVATHYIWVLSAMSLLEARAAEGRDSGA
ncbi:MAG: O-antigen ligase family protein, partial [Candidatus Eisenbacteria bacterium]|nr:O-antigen ligase family protein [Candidatus Eisenbacteria bacterium]